MEIVLVNTAPSYGEKIWVDNIVHMLKNVDAKYDDLHVIDDALYGGVYDKLRIFDLFRTGRYLYFDLDVVIGGDISHLWCDEFTLLHAWWRPEFHTPLNSSIMSWSGDCSYLHDNFVKELDYNLVKYYKGIDEYFYKECEYKTYGMVCDSYSWNGGKLPITLYNHDSKDKIWHHECSLLGSEKNTDKT